MKRILVMAAVLTLAWSGSSAQDALTDDEQFASYCWGVTVLRNTVAKTFAARECPEADADCRQFRTRAATQAAEDEAASRRLAGELDLARQLSRAVPMSVGSVTTPESTPAKDDRDASEVRFSLLELDEK